MCNSKISKTYIQDKIDQIYYGMEEYELFNLKVQSTLIKKVSFIKGDFTRKDIDYLYEWLYYYIENFNIYIYTNLIKLCFKKKLSYIVDEIIKEMKSNKIKPTVITFNTLIDYYCKNNNLEKGEYYYDLMIKDKLLEIKKTWGEIDVHGLARWSLYFYLEKNKEKLVNVGIICGRGNNSKGEPVLKEVIIEFCEKYNKKYTICSKGGKITIN